MKSKLHRLTMKSLKNLQNKVILAVSLLAISSNSSQAQLSKQWDYRFGGTAIDEFHDVLSIIDTNNFDGKGYLLAGYSESGIGGDKTTASQGSGDFWLINLNSQGVKQWDKSYGGSAYDELFEVQQTNDGGFILGGWSNSGISGDKSQASIGAGDYWVVRTDMHGTKLWDKTFGGTSEDYLQSIKQTNDGGYILAGRSNSGISGNKTQANRGTVGVNWDYWIVKISSTGAFQWDQTYGGVEDDWLFSIEQTNDGGYILGGYSNSGITGEKSQASQGLDDYWIIKTDASGVKQWDKSFGGTSADQLQMVTQTSDGGYLLGGASASGATGDKSQASRGNFDYWIVKTTAAGVKQWDKRFGGTSADNLFDIIQTTDGGYLLGGASSSAAGGDKSQGNQGTVGTSFDYWLVKTDANGIAQVDKRFGGTSDDYAKSISETPDGNYVLAGWSTSGANGDKTQATRGSIDYWMLKVSGPNSVTTTAIPGPLCAGSNVNVSFTVTGTFNAGNIFTAQLSDSSGSFAFPSDIGTLSGTTSGTINATLPFTFASSHYKIQVVSSNPVAQDIYPTASIQLDSPSTYYIDADNDGYGASNGTPTLSCTPIAGWVLNNFDCNDGDPLVFQLPGNPDGIFSLSSNCEGSSGNLFNILPLAQASSYQWFLSSGLSSTFVNNITTDSIISIAIAVGTTNGLIGVIGMNSCGVTDTAFYNFNVSPLPQAAGAISGSTQIVSCLNQNNITYIIAPIANATNYVWTLPDSAVIVGNLDTNSIVVNYSPYGVSGTLSVYGTNSCGPGVSSNLAINYKPIPKAEICGISVDSATQKGILQWQRPLESYADSIVILRKNRTTNLYEKIATKANVSPGIYKDTTSSPNLQAEEYKLAVKDSCENIGELSVAVNHRTIYLYGLLGWSNIPKLYWNDYEGINDTDRYYNVLRDVTGSGPFSIIKDSIPYNGPLNYTDVNGASCSTCRYLIELVYSSNCDPNLRIMTSKSTSRSNVANRVAMIFDTLLTNIKGINSGVNFSVSPNPSKENMLVKFEGPIKNCDIEIYTIIGERIWRKSISNIQNNEIEVLPTQSFNRGVYILRLNPDGNDFYKKIILD